MESFSHHNRLPAEIGTEDLPNKSIKCHLSTTLLGKNSMCIKGLGTRTFKKLFITTMFLDLLIRAEHVNVSKPVSWQNELGVVNLLSCNVVY
jgi:hypothetical protein